MTASGDVFAVMLASLYAVDVTEEQFNGILGWQPAVARAERLAGECGRAVAFPFRETRNHVSWTGQCRGIIAALRSMEATGDLMFHDYEEREVAARAGAARHQMEEDRLRALRDEYLSAAGRVTDAESIPLRVLAQRAEDARLAAEEEAVRASREAIAAAGVKGKADKWRQAANTAAGMGLILVRSQNAVHIPVMNAVADVGPGNVAASKHNYQGASA